MKAHSVLDAAQVGGVVHLHRVLKTSPNKVYRAFLESGALAKWLPPYGFTCTVHHLEPRVGGTFGCRFTTSAVVMVIHLVANTLSSSPTNGSDITISLKTPTYPASWK